MYYETFKIKVKRFDVTPEKNRIEIHVFYKETSTLT